MNDSPAVKLTYDDFVRFPDDGKRHELIDGEHYVTPSSDVRHQDIVGSLGAMIWLFLESHPIGHVFMAPLDVIASDVNVVVPDVLYVGNARAAQVLTPEHVRGVPDLVVEVGSEMTRKRDETIKRRLYERFGVEEYWVVDPEIDVVRIYRRTEQGFGRPLELTREAGDVLTTPLLPGLELPVARVLR